MEHVPSVLYRIESIGEGSNYIEPNQSCLISGVAQAKVNLDSNHTLEASDDNARSRLSLEVLKLNLPVAGVQV